MALIEGDGRNNTLRGTSDGDRIRGFGGYDWLYGLAGNDRLEGGAGQDNLRGGDGRDLLIGGLGRDIMYGGAGRDTFAFDDKDAGDATAGPLSDVIFDFSEGDVLDLMAVDVVDVSFDDRSPERGSFSIWQTNGSTYVTWNTFGAFHDVELRGFTGDPYDQIRWYQDDYLANEYTTGRIASGQTRTGTIEVPEDDDWFRIELAPDREYTFDVRGLESGGGSLETPAVGVSGYSGDGGLPSLSFFVNNSGTYYVQVSGLGGVGTYELAVTSTDVGDLYAGNSSTTGRMATGETLSSEIDAVFDHDWFRIQLTEGRTYTIDLKGDWTGAGTLGNPALNLIANGSIVAANDDWGDTFDARIIYTAPATGTYYIDAYGSSVGGDYRGTYELSVAAGDLSFGM